MSLIKGDSIGEAAYFAYGEFTEGKNYRGEPMPAWADLPENIRAAWQYAAAAAVVFQRWRDEERPGS